MLSEVPKKHKNNEKNIEIYHSCSKLLFIDNYTVYEKVYLCLGFTKGDHRRKSWEIHTIHLHGVDEPQSKYVIIYF